MAVLVWYDLPCNAGYDSAKPGTIRRVLRYHYCHLVENEALSIVTDKPFRQNLLRGELGQQLWLSW